MRNHLYCLLVVICSCFMFGGCAKSEVVKAEEPVVPVVVAAPEEAKPAPEQPKSEQLAQKPAEPVAPVKVDVVPEPVKVPETPPKSVAAETVVKTALETIYFDFDKFDLREHDREILTRNAGLLLGVVKGKIQIEGHCDERGSAEYNLALGERRARSAMNYLVTLGVPAERLSIISYGEEKPVDPGHNEEAWAKNRRAEFVNMGE